MARNLIIGVAFTLMALTPAFTQDLFPELSYNASSITTAGFTTFKISYGRPLQRGRALYGAFIPFDQRWRAGANGTTTIAFDTPVYLGDTKIDAGTYALLTIPGNEKWEIILHRDTTMFTQRKDYLISDEVAHISVGPKKIQQHQEAFTIFTDIVKDDLEISLVWDFTRVRFTLQTRAHESALNALRTKIKNGELKTAEELAEGANFLAFNYSHLGQNAKDTAVLLINKAIALEPQGWYYRIKRDIFWFSKDLKGIKGSTNEWLNYYQSTKPENYLENIQTIKDELTWYEKTLRH